MYDISSSKKQIESNNKKKLSTPNFSFVFLSLILCLLCFFIYLVQNSTFEKVKVDALKVSLQTSFSQNQPLFQKVRPSFEIRQIATFHQKKIAKIFTHSKIHQDLINDEISIFIPTNAIFKETSSEFQTTASVLFHQIDSLFKNDLIKNKYIMDFVLFEDLTKEQNFPIFEHLTTQRLQKFSERIKDTSLLLKNYSIGIEKGDASFLKLHFRKRRT